MRQAVLVIDGIPYTFPQGFIEAESYSIGSDVQIPNTPGFSPIITPVDRTASIDLVIPMGEWKNRLAYKVAKETIRASTFIFSQRDKVESEEVDVGRTINIPFTSLKVPWEIQISCAYFGIGIQLACCIITNFTISTSPNSNTNEAWNIELVEYDISNLRKKPVEEPEVPKAETPSFLDDI